MLLDHNHLAINDVGLKLILKVNLAKIRKT